jgi:hypothetical protein
LGAKSDVLTRLELEAGDRQSETDNDT